MTRHPIPAHWPLYGVIACFLVHLLTYDALSSVAFTAACLWAGVTLVSALYCLTMRQWRRALLMALPCAFLVLMLGYARPVRERITDWGTELRFAAREHTLRAATSNGAGARHWVLGLQGPTEYRIIYDPTGELVARTVAVYGNDGCSARVRHTKPPFYTAAVTC